MAASRSRPREGLVSDLSPSELRAMKKFNRGLAVVRGKRHVKTFVLKHEQKIVLGIGLGALALYAFLKLSKQPSTP